MKKFRKLLSLVLAMVMVLAMAAPSFAATESGTNTAQKGQITIENAIVDKTYKLYKIFDLESYSYAEGNEGETSDEEEARKEAGQYSYKVVSEWKDFITDYKIDGEAVFTLDSNGYLTDSKDMTAAQSEAFAQAALNHAVTCAIECKIVEDENAASGYKMSVTTKPNGATVAVETKTVDEKEQLQIIIEGIDLGYYLLDSSVGALCSLNTTNPAATISEKNEVPEIKKTVSGGEYMDSDNDNHTDNSASVDDDLSFTITVDNNKGAQNYVITDTMSKGLTYNSSSLKVYKNTINDDNEVKNGTTEYYISDYKIDPTSKITTLTITFKDPFYAGLELNDTIIITYTATINGDAVTVENPITNTAELKYGNEHTVSSTTRTYSYDIGIIKTDKDGVPLDGAVFELYSSKKQVNAEGTEEIVPDSKISVVGVLKESGNLADSNTQVSQIEYYRPAEKTETANVVSIKAGNIEIRGLGKGTYFLNETKAPEGYNKLVEMKLFSVDEKDNRVSSLVDNKYNGGGVQVINNTGSLLPSTGGIGTTVFYAVGIVLMAGAVFFVVRRKRA